MRVLLKNTITKKIMIVLITIVMMSNFIMPNYVCAKSAGEKLVSGIFYLIAYVGDVGIKVMQKMMIGTNEIKDGKEYDIKYSPGLIFSNSIIALDVNFIEPNEKFIVREGTTTTKTEQVYDEEEKYFDSTGKTSSELYEDAKAYIEAYKNSNGFSSGTKVLEDENKYDEVLGTGWFAWYSEGIDHEIRLERISRSAGYSDDYQYTYKVKITARGEKTVEDIDSGKRISSPAKELQKNISKWYIALRTVALVGLLSVLLYIGIRIILSSASANDKAKYKNMLKDWIVAICVLFTLHYIMAFMLQMTESLNNIINNNVVKESTSEPAEGSTAEYKTDKLMNAVRKGVGDSYDDASALNTASYTIMYLALVILTGVFTVQYLKRVIYMAFLTMIAPMIALTYPLDKIKDNKAQAFNFWLKEYIFNCLIQPVHFLLYTLLISNVGDFATNNMLYSVVALGFLVPAEKLIKEMFGMKSATPVGTLGAAAGGAMVMSMLNKMKAKPPKGEGKDGSGSDAPKGVRTATRSSGGNSSANGGNGAGAGVNSGAENGGETNGVRTTGTGTPTVTANASGNSTNTSTSNRKAGAKALGKKYIYGPNALKSHLGRFTGVIGGAAGGTIGIAAGIASGNFGDALKYGAAGAATGYQGASNLTKGTIDDLKGIPEHIHNVGDTWVSGAQGVEAASNRKFDREFYKSDGYKQIVQDKALLDAFGGKEGIQAATQQFLDNGITDAADIRKAMQNGVTGDELKEYSKLGIKAPEEIAAAKAKWGSASYYANLKKIAKFAKNKSPEEFKAIISQIKIDGTNTPSAAEVDKIYENIIELL